MSLLGSRVELSVYPPEEEYPIIVSDPVVVENERVEFLITNDYQEYAVSDALIQITDSAIYYEVTNTGDFPGSDGPYAYVLEFDQSNIRNVAYVTTDDMISPEHFSGGYDSNTFVLEIDGLNYYQGQNILMVVSFNLFGGNGSDSITGGLGDDYITGGEGFDTLFGDIGYDYINGNQGEDFINGNMGNDSVEGGKDNDHVEGGKDNDWVHGNLGDDFVHGNMGDDEVQGGQGNDEVQGGQGNDVVYGNRDNDTVYGNLGDDFINGGHGVDQLIGGDGRDVFAFVAGEANGDTVLDFSSSDDQFLFAGYGEDATFSRVDSTHWRIASADGATQDIITIGNGASITADDFAFV